MITLRKEVMGPHMTKFHLEGLPFPAVLHRFTESDRGNPHDHPWAFRSHVLVGGYREEVFDVATGVSTVCGHVPDERTDMGPDFRLIAEGRLPLTLEYLPRWCERHPEAGFDVPADRVHRITELLAPEVWTLVLPLGPKVREPGFYRWDAEGMLHRPWHRPDFRREVENAVL